MAGRVPQAVYLLGFALGPVVLAPLSEDYGRWPTMVGSCLILGLTQIACALAPNLTVLIIFRFIGGYFASATFNAIGFVSDMWNAEEQGWVVNAYALFAEVGAVLGPIVGGYIFERHGWRWIFGVSGSEYIYAISDEMYPPVLNDRFSYFLIATVVLAGLLVTFAVFAPETRAGVILTRRAKQLRKKTGDTRYYAMHEKVRSEHTPSALAREMLVRPLFMLFTEPIVASFGLFDGVNYAIIYMFLECFPLVYAQYGFTVSQQGLPFIGVMVGFFIAFGSYAIQDALHRRAAHKSKTGEAPPEARLLWGMPGGLLFPISLL